MRKSGLFLMFLIFLLALGFAASEEVKDEKMSFDLIFNTNVLNDTLEIHVVLSHDATGSVLYTIDGKQHKVNVKNGDAPLNVTDLNPGKYELKANYSGDENFSDIENKTNVTIPEASKLGLADNSTGNDTNDTDPVKNITNATNNITNKTNNVTNKTDSKNVTNNVTNKTNTKNVTSLLNNFTNKTDSKNTTNSLKNITNNTTNPVNNVTNKTNNTVVNNTTVVVTVNQIANNTTTGNDKPVDNISEVAHNSPKKPKINQNNNPYKLDAKTGIPIALVIIAIAIFIGVKRYNL